MNNYLTKIDISTYTETSIEEIEKTIDDIKMADRGHVFGISTIAVGGVIVITLIIIISCMVWQRRRVSEIFSRMNPRKPRDAEGKDTDHAQAIGLLFQHGRTNRQVGPFLIDEGEEDVAIRCRRPELDNFLRNFDNMKLTHELTNQPPG